MILPDSAVARVGRRAPVPAQPAAFVEEGPLHGPKRVVHRPAVEGRPQGPPSVEITVSAEGKAASVYLTAEQAQVLAHQIGVALESLTAPETP